MKVCVYKKNSSLFGDSEGSVFISSCLHAVDAVNADSPTMFLTMKTVHLLPFTVLVDGNGGVASSDSLFGFVGKKIGQLPDAQRGNDWFEGWEDLLGRPVNSETVITESCRTIAARYTEARTISFVASTEIVGVSSMIVWEGHRIGENGEAMPSAAPNGDLTFVGWYTDQETGDRVSAQSIYDGSYSVLYARYAANSFEADLSFGWQRLEDEGMYEVYVSTSHEDDFAQKLRIHTVGYNTFSVIIRSDAESTYDYVVAFDPDFEPGDSVDGSYDDGSDDPGDHIKASTSGRQKTDVEVVYELDGGEHDIWFTYRKDGSVSDGEDVGFVKIRKDQ